jgi:hypothetical protein
MRVVAEPTRPQSPSLAAIVAIVAALAGVTLVVAGVVGVVGSIESTPTPNTVAFVTTTTPSPGTTVPSTSVPTSAPVTVPSSTVDGSVAFATVVDDSGRLSVEFPFDWTDVSGGGWTVDGGEVGVSVSAAIDRGAWYDGWGTPGAFLGISEVTLDEFTPELVDFAGACRLADAGGREYPGYTTVVQEWVECGDEGSQLTTALVWPSSFGWSGLIQIVSLDGTATSLLDHAIATLSYEPTP